MSKKFVRNITDTRIKGAIQEPLNTNIQNDLLSDDEDVAVRNKDEYHLLTDNVKSITSENDGIKVKVTGKNSRELVAKIVELTTETDEVTITNPETNVFTIDIDFSNYASKQYVQNEIENIPSDDKKSFVFSVDDDNVEENMLHELNVLVRVMEQDNGKWMMGLVFIPSRKSEKPSNVCSISIHSIGYIKTNDYTLKNILTDFSQFSVQPEEIDIGDNTEHLLIYEDISEDVFETDMGHVLLTINVELSDGDYIWKPNIIHTDISVNPGDIV